MGQGHAQVEAPEPLPKGRMGHGQQLGSQPLGLDEASWWHSGGFLSSTWLCLSSRKCHCGTLAQSKGLRQSGVPVLRPSMLAGGALCG